MESALSEYRVVKRAKRDTKPRAEHRDPYFAELEQLIADEKAQGQHRQPKAPHKSRIDEHAAQMRAKSGSLRERGTAGLFYYRSSMTEICDALSTVTELPVSAIRGTGRADVVVQARQLAFWLMRELTPASLPTIGALFGGRHHTTVLHGIRAMERRCAIWPEWDALARKLLDEIRESMGARREAAKTLGEVAVPRALPPNKRTSDANQD
jgi:hypothetical protein